MKHDRYLGWLVTQILTETGEPPPTFTIVAEGRTYRYGTLAAAEAAASAVFNATGVIVGIEQK